MKSGEICEAVSKTTPRVTSEWVGQINKQRKPAFGRAGVHPVGGTENHFSLLRMWLESDNGSCYHELRAGSCCRYPVILCGQMQLKEVREREMRANDRGQNGRTEEANPDIWKSFSLLSVAASLPR